MKKIAILGATGHIAKGLIENLCQNYRLDLFSRNQQHAPLGLFPYNDYDVVINCIGVREKLWTEPIEIFRIFERFDNMILDYLQKHPETLYINFSSGAVFGGSFPDPVNNDTVSIFDVNWVEYESKTYFYGIAKLNSEAKHRALKDLNIVDIRVFSYFSKYLSPNSRCFMNEMLSCVQENRVLKTSRYNFYRDYIHPNDLAQLIECCIEVHDLNVPFDAYSLRPTSKFEMLDYFQKTHGLQYQIVEDFPENSPTGSKENYYSVNTGASEIGYSPQYDSMAAIREGAAWILTSGRAL